MLVTLLGIVTLVNESHSKKALEPMLVTLLGIVTLVNDSQPEKAYLSMLVTPSGIVTLVNLYPRKTPEPISVTVIPPSVDGMVNEPVGLGEIPVTVTELPLTS